MIEEALRKAAAYRTEQGWTQREIARRMSTRQSAISDIENYRFNPSIELITRYLEALGLVLSVTAPIPADGRCPLALATGGAVVRCRKPNGHERHQWYSGSDDELINSRTPVGQALSREVVGDLEDRLRTTAA